MARFLLTNKAVEDLTNIWHYTIETWSENQADKYYKSLIDSFQEITENSKIGRNYGNVENELKGFNVNKHIVFYRKISDDVVEITRILHTMMDIKNKLKE